jgi:RimJ/RimL family protein N-acetyltransferase
MLALPGCRDLRVTEARQAGHEWSQIEACMRLARPRETMDLQPQLRNALVTLRPVQEDDFEALFAIASDPQIWVQHPNPMRYQRAVFENYFAGALESKGALLIYRTRDRTLIGCTRYYDFDAGNRSVKIGYTFFARSSWGRGLNTSCKALMLKHAFQHVERVLFEVGQCNLRSQVAMTRMGARRIGEAAVAYHGEASMPNVIFEITRADWDAGLK